MTDGPKDGATSAPTKRARRGIRLHTDPPPVSFPPSGFPIATVANRFGAVEQRELVNWSALVERLTHVKPGPKDGPAWLPADIDPGPRSAERVRAWSVLPLDVEATTHGTGEAKTVVGLEPPPLAEILDELQASGWRGIGHTTHSHLDPTIQPTDREHHRYRLVFALSRPLAPAEIRPLGLHLAAVLGLSECVDAKCLEPARLLYLPRCPQGRLEHFQARAVEGEPLDVDALLEAAARAEAMLRAVSQAPPPAHSTPQDGPSVITAFNEAHDPGELLTRHGYIPKGRGRWLHPASSSGMPGVRLLSETGKVYSDHGADPLADGHPHDAFDLYRILAHGGDQKAAVREAARLLGLSRGGSSRRASPHEPPIEAPPPAPPEDLDDSAPPSLPPENLRLGQYLWRGGEFYLVRVSVGRGADASPTETLIKLANFSAIVTEERQRDDGETVENATLLTIFQPRGGRITETLVEIPTDRFAGLTWITPKLGHHFVVTAGNSIRDHLRACIQTFSAHFQVQTRRVYTHSGWRKIGGELHYLHAGGAITAHGARDDLAVDLPDPRYHLSAPPAPPELREAVRATLRLVELSTAQPGIGAVQLARIAAPPLAPWVRLDWGVFVVGRTGCLKTELAALAMAHYGQFHARALPGSWESSEGALLLQAHAVKDALFEIDDFNPSGAAHDQAQLAKKADRVFRGAANAAGRERLTADIRLRKGQHPRGLVSASGEDLPPGRSLRARLWTVELDVGSIDLPTLTACQRDAAQGVYRQSLAGYLQWLAGRADDLGTKLPTRYETLRTQAPEALRAHGRIPSNLAGLTVALETFVTFAVDVGALESDQAHALLVRLVGALQAQAKNQADIQDQSEDATRFMEMLRAALATGRAHLVDAAHWPATRPPTMHAALLGWRGRIRQKDDPDDGPRYEEQGELIGYVEGTRGEVWLMPDAAYSIVSRIARDQNAGALRTPARLGRALVEKGYLRSGEGRNVGYRHGRRGITPPRVWCLPMAKLVEAGE